MISKLIGDVVNTNHDIISSIQRLSNISLEIGVKDGLRVRKFNIMNKLIVEVMLGS